MTSATSHVCPDDATLRHYLAAEPEEGDTALLDLGRHLAACRACQARLELWCADPVLEMWSVEPPGAGEQAFLDGLSRSWASGLEPPGSTRGQASAAVPEQIGPYRITRCAGTGGMGTVYEATDPVRGHRVALKLLRADLGSLTGETAPDRFRREAAVLAALDHPNIVPVSEVGEHEGRPYLVMAYVAGGSLAEWAAGRPLPPAAVARTVATLARAVQYAHERGVVHRDLKPENVLLQPLPGQVRTLAGAPGAADPPLEAFRPMIVDFGLARWEGDRDRSALTRTGQPIGTPAYMAPEQVAAGPLAAAPGVDIHALGVLLYELLTGRPPYRGADVIGTLRLVAEADPVSPRVLQPTVPVGLETITLHCLELDPRHRYATAAALADDLERFLAHRSLVARPIGLAGRARRWSRRNPAAAGLGALALALLLALAAGGTWFAAEQWRHRLESDALRADAELSQQRAQQRAADLLTVLRLAQLDAGQASQDIRRVLGVLDQHVDRLAEVGPAPAPPLAALRQAWYRSAALWCESYLARFERGDSWDVVALEAARVLAKIRAELGQLEAAERLALSAVTVAGRLVDADPSSDEAVAALVAGTIGLGDLRIRLGRPGVALESFGQAAVQLRDRPASPAILRLRAANELRTATVLDGLGRAAEAAGSRRAGLDALEALVAGGTGTPADRLTLAAAAEALGAADLAAGRADAAAVALTAGLDALAGLPADTPEASTAPDLRRRLLNQLARARGEGDPGYPDLP